MDEKPAKAAPKARGFAMMLGSQWIFSGTCSSNMCFSSKQTCASLEKWWGETWECVTQFHEIVHIWMFCSARKTGSWDGLATSTGGQGEGKGQGQVYGNGGDSENSSLDP